MTINNMNSVAPNFLKKGDIIEILAPAKFVTQEDLSFAKSFLEGLGYQVYIDKSNFMRDGVFAGTKRDRTDRLQTSLDNKDVKAILFARGGYGTLQIIDDLSFTKFVRNPKWLIGFSDITTIMCHIQQNFKIQSIHAPMAYNFNFTDKRYLKMLVRMLEGKRENIKIKSSNYNTTGTVQGEVIGGNLSILYSLVGSQSLTNLKNQILFIEEIDEYLYHFERMLISLDRCGFLSNISGIIVGQMTSMHDNKIGFGKELNQIIFDITEKYNYPKCFDFPLGHIKGNTPIVIGSTVRLSVAKDYSTLSYSIDE